MNCEEVLDVLDNQRMDRLDAERRRQVDAHMAVCADCARAWNLQAGLAALPDLAMPAGFAARCRARVASSVRAADGRRVARPIWRVAAVASIAAVAAILVYLLRPDSTAPEPATQVAETAITPRVIEAVPRAAAAGIVPAVLVETVPEPRFTVRLQPNEPFPPEQLRAGARREMYEPLLRANNADPAREQAMQALHSVLAGELRKVPGLMLVAADPSEVSPAHKHFVLKVGFTVNVDSKLRGLPVNPDYVQAQLDAEELQPGGKTVSRHHSYARIDMVGGCSGVAAPATNPCGDVKGVAASMVEVLLQKVFPPPPSVSRPLQAKFRDASLDQAQRLEALDELYRQQMRGDASVLRDPGVVSAALAMAATADPVLKARLWRSLRGVADPELVQHMLASLAQDPEDVRLAAIETLSADFSGDPRVRAALQATAHGDQSPLVRAVARRALEGEGPWRQYVVSSLKDTGRPALQRLEALVYYLYPPGPTERTSTDNPDYWEVMKDIFADDAALSAFAGSIPDAGRLRGGNGGLLLISNIGYRYTQSPAITDMMLRILESDPLPRRRSVAGEVLARAHASEPRVLDALNKALAGDPDKSVRDWIRQILAERSQP